MLVTFSLLCHNHQSFIREAVRSAFAQDYEPLEILISDDHSSDATVDIIQEEIGSYTGPHSVRLIKHNRDVGWENWSRAAEATRGEFVVGAHGDDISHPERTRRLVEAWRATNASLLSSNAEIIDAESRPVRVLNPKSENQFLSAAEIARAGFHPCMHGATLAWHPDLFRSFEPLDNLRLGAAYDHVLPFRGAVLKGSYYVAQPLVKWRVHGKNLGNQQSDRTRGALVQMETECAYDLGARICMLDDLDYRIKRDGGTKELEELRQILIAKIVKLARSFTFRRNELIAAGSRPTWISKAEMEGRVDYSKGYYGFGLGPVSAKLRRMLAKIVKRFGTMS